MKNSVGRLTAAVIRMLEEEVAPHLQDATVLAQLRAATTILENIAVGAVWTEPPPASSLTKLHMAAAVAGLNPPDGELDLCLLADAVFDLPPATPDAARTALRKALLESSREQLRAARALTSKPLMARLSGAPAR